jgi:hypothetical protein
MSEEEEEEEDVIRETETKSTKDNGTNIRIVTGHVYNDGDAVKEEEEEEEAFKKNVVAGKKKTNDREKTLNDDASLFSFSWETHRSLAEEKAYMWAKVKGSPFWPCQVVDVEKFKENVPEFVREKVLRGGGGGGGGEDDEDEAKSNNNNNSINSVKLIQFFGTNEYMWYVEPTKALTAEEEEERRKKKANGGGGGAKNNCGGNIFRKVEMESFGDGCDKGYHVKMKTVGLKRAVNEMRECLESGEDPSDVKRGGLQWHTRTIVAEEEEEEEEENAKKTEEKKNNNKKKKVSPSSSAGKRKKAETQKTSAAAKERAQKKAKKLSEEEKKREEKAAAAAAKAAVKMELAAQKEEERKKNEPATLETLFNVKSIEEKPFQLSFDVLSARDPPPFERLRRNRWVCRQAPRQVHSSEAVACYCRPIPHSIREEMNANISTERAMKIASASTTTAAEAAAPLDSITNKLAAGGEDDAQQQQQQISEEKGPATPPETLEDPLNNSNSGGSVKDKEKKAPAAKPLPKLRLGCGQDCVNRETRYTCDSRVCPCGDDCSNRPFQYLPQPKVKVQLTENRGYGLFLQQDVFEGDFIVEYMGEIVDEEECSRRLLACKGKNEPNFYLMEITPSQIIDARFCGNNARFINSSCHPNCETQRWVDASTNETRVGIFATEDIKSGTELTYDYNFAHFGGEGTTSFTCFCGHPMCKGTLDANPERMRRFMDRVTVTMKNGDVKTGTVLEYTVNKKYKLLLDDEHDAKAWSNSTISEEEKAELALKRTKNRKYITVNLDNVDGTANDVKKSGAKKDAKLACVWLTNRTNFTESKIKKKKVDLNEKKKTAKGADAKNKKRKRKPTKRPPPPASKQQQHHHHHHQPPSKTATSTMSPLKEIVVTPVKRLVESAIANVVNRQQNNRNPSSSSKQQQQQQQQQKSPIQRALHFFANK